MGIALVQEATPQLVADGDEATSAFGVAPTAGNLLVGVAAITRLFTDVNDLIPPSGWSTAIVVEEANDDRKSKQGIFYKENCPTTNSFLLQVDDPTLGFDVDICWYCYEYAGAATVGALRNTFQAVGNSTLPDTGLRSVLATDLIIAGISNQNNNSQTPFGYTGSGTWTTLEHNATVNSTGAERCRLSTHELVTASNQDVRVQANAFSAARSWVALMATFKEASAAPPPPAARRLSHAAYRM